MMQAEAAFAPDLGSAPAARRFAERTLRTWGCDHVVEPARLLVSELVANAVLHAQTRTAVRLKFAGGVLRVEVEDGSAARPEARHVAADAPSGRGLHIVAALAAAWGVDEAPDGKVVWFELDAD